VTSFVGGIQGFAYVYNPGDLVLKVQLKRDLRRHILRGHPWLYQDAIQAPVGVDESSLCQVLDSKGKALAWGFYCPNSPLAVRILSMGPKPPKVQDYADRVLKSYELRRALLSPQTTAFRVVNGEGDGLPGFVCDLYDRVAVIQFDGDDCTHFWSRHNLPQQMLQHLPIDGVYHKPRGRESQGQWWGKETPDLVEIQENAVQFKVDIHLGQKTGFFLDQRNNRDYVRRLAQGKRVLNLFSYTGGFSVYAGVGGAHSVTSVDLAPQAIDLAQKNWELNGLRSEDHQGISADVFDFLKVSDEKWDVVIVDPPSMTHSEKTKAIAMKSYGDLFAQAIARVHPGQHICLSSCSSHISFDDFFEIINQSLSQRRMTGRILRVSGQGEDHPYPHFCPELRYLKFVHLQLNP
jgi:23S rRNA (cytosine1962-C5)-methyltransferase